MQQQESKRLPAIVMSALRGGSGKTILSVGIIAAWARLGKKKVAPFKKGPDYIDAGWLALAAGRPCYNLDTFLIDEPDILSSFHFRSRKSDVVFIEGNRGLYDCIDVTGDTSTAELAKLLHAPIILCLDCTKTTRTMAAVVMGCAMFDPDAAIKGIILNRVAGPRHRNILKNSIEHHCGIPVIGALPKLDQQIFPERHMGLVPTPEHHWAKDSIDRAASLVSENIDLDALARIAEESGKADDNQDVSNERESITLTHYHEDDPIKNEQIIQENEVLENEKPVIGVIRDSSFQFYYPENIEALKLKGAKITFFSPLANDVLPELDALYIGGGFPETHAKQLSENLGFRNEIKRLAENGLPIYAECGGLMYLGEKLVLDEKSFPMTGVLPVVFGFSKKPQGHGYTIVEVAKENPYYKPGTIIKGHEFHYSKVLSWHGDEDSLVFDMKRGKGITDKKDGALYKNVLATYTHIHALGIPSWADSFVRLARSCKKSKK